MIAGLGSRDTGFDTALSDVRRLAGCGIHRTGKHWISLACRGHLDGGCVFCCPNSYHRSLDIGHSWNLFGNRRRGHRFLARQEVRRSPHNRIRPAYRIDEGTDQNRSVAVPAIRGPICLQRPVSAIPAQHGCGTGRCEQDAAAEVLFCERDRCRLLGNRLRGGRLFPWRGIYGSSRIDSGVVRRGHNSRDSGIANPDCAI
jgi:hypothetical protein